MRKILLKILIGLLIVGVLLGGWITFDIYKPHKVDIRDNKAEAGGVTEEDWKRIDELLHESWRSLHQAVNKK